MKKVIKPVINCAVRAHVKLSKRALRVYNNMTANSAIFPGTSADVTQLGTDQVLYASYIADAKGDDKVKAQRNTMAETIMGDLKALLSPVDKVANNDPAIIALSGFDSSAEPTPHSIPVKVVIKRIVNGETNLSGKIYIEPMGQTGLTFNVRITTVANAGVNDPSWVLVLQTTNST
jgi:hypothetical protein